MLFVRVAGLKTFLVVTWEVPRTRTGLGDRSVAVAGSLLSNDLPQKLRDSQLTFITLQPGLLVISSYILGRKITQRVRFQ